MPSEKDKKWYSKIFSFFPGHRASVTRNSAEDEAVNDSAHSAIDNPPEKKISKKIGKKIKDTLKNDSSENNCPPTEEKESPETEEKNETISQIDEFKDIFNRVIEPEERTFKNYLSLKFWNKKRNIYKKIREKEKQDLNIYAVLSDGARPSIEYYVLTILSCIIATLGLIQGATAIIIGAMIVAPLMTPILAFSLAVIWGDFPLLRISVSSILKGIFWGIVISSLIAYVVPLPTLSDEIISRTHPSLFDVMIALASGIVGAYGYSNKKISNTIIGIAIAVALMPPLCTIGIGIGIGKINVAAGAALLFLINLVSISLAGAAVFWSMKIHPIHADQDKIKKRALSQIIISFIVLILISIPVGIYMYEGYRLSEAEKDTINAFKSRFPGISIFNSEIENRKGRIAIILTLTGDEIPDKNKIMELKNIILKEHTEIAGIKIRFFVSRILTQ